MSQYQLIFSILSAIILFLFGLNAFSKEIKAAAGERMESFMRTLTANRFIGALSGAMATAIIQSSTAVSAIAVSLVDSGILSFQGALAILLGSYIGTTATAWMVSFKLAGIGPVFIVLGAFLGFINRRTQILGKAIFYFGFIFFSLDLVSTSLAPLKESPQIREMLLYSSNPLAGIFIGIFMTILLQSSTVVTGLAIIFVQQGLLPPAGSIPIVLGANIGTTTTALVASFQMGLTAKKTAIANIVMNVVGVAVFIPLLKPYTDWVIRISPDSSYVVAVCHLTFNVVTVTLFLIFLSPFTKFMNRLVK